MLPPTHSVTLRTSSYHPERLKRISQIFSSRSVANVSVTCGFKEYKGCEKETAEGRAICEGHCRPLASICSTRLVRPCSCCFHKFKLQYAWRTCSSTRLHCGVADKSDDCSVIAFSSKWCKRVTRPILAAKLFAMMEGFDVGSSMARMFEQILGKKIECHVCIDSRTLYTIAALVGTIAERLLAIDASMLHEAHVRKEMTKCFWIPFINITTHFSWDCFPTNSSLTHRLGLIAVSPGTLEQAWRSLLLRTDINSNQNPVRAVIIHVGYHMTLNINATAYMVGWQQWHFVLLDIWRHEYVFGRSWWIPHSVLIVDEHAFTSDDPVGAKTSRK